MTLPAEVLMKILEEYFGGKYDILSNCSLMDSNLSCFHLFGENVENEIDVVALFTQASPRIILRETNVNWVPLEGTSFICEVKSRVDKGRLESDLEKLEVVRSLEVEPSERFGDTASLSSCVDHQLHCLVYDRSSISDETLDDLLRGNDSWDLILLVEEDILIVNRSLPISEYFHQAITSARVQHTDMTHGTPPKIDGSMEDSWCISLKNGFAWFIIVLSITIPVPLGVNTASTVSELITRSSTGARLGATSAMDEDDIIEFQTADAEDIDKG